MKIDIYEKKRQNNLLKTSINKAARRHQQEREVSVEHEHKFTASDFPLCMTNENIRYDDYLRV